MISPENKENNIRPTSEQSQILQKMKMFKYVKMRKISRMLFKKYKKELTKEEKAERQRIKNRESAQLSRDRKKMLENVVQQDLNFLTQENKHLQSLIKQSYTCQQCGFYNNPPQNGNTEYSSTTKLFNQSCKENHINSLNPDSVQYRCPQVNENASQQLGVENSTSAPGLSNPVYQFFDFSRTNAPLMQASPLNFCGFGKGVWSTTFVIFVLYMMLVFSGTQSDPNGTIGSNFRNLQLVGPYAQFFEQYKNLTQEQLLEQLLTQIQKLKDSEREEQIQQLKLIQMIANAASTTTTTSTTTSTTTTTTSTTNNAAANTINEEPSTSSELNQSQKTNSYSTQEDNEKDLIIEESESQTSSSSTAATSALLEKIQALEKEVTVDEKPIQQGFLDFCKQYKEIQSSNENERNYYKDLSNKLDELQREKLMQLEQLKQVYCIAIPEVPTFSHEAPIQQSQSQQQQQLSQQQSNSQEQFFTPKMQFPSTYYSEKQFYGQALNPAILQESSLEKFQSVVGQPQYDTSNYQGYNSNNNYNSPPTFDNISQFFNDTASFKQDEGINSSLSSSQNLDSDEMNQEQDINQEEEYYQYRQMMRTNQQQQQQQQQPSYGQQHIERDENIVQNNEIHMIGEEEDPFSVIPHINPKKSSINYYELMQRKNNEGNQPSQQQLMQSQGQAQQIACSYSFQQQPHQIEEYQNSNSTNSINLQNIQNGKIQQYNLLFSPHQNAHNNGKDEQVFQNYDVEKYIKFSCKFVEDNCIKKDGF